MRVSGQQRTSRSKPSISPNKRAKNKRGAMSEVTSPVKIKKRKLQPLVDPQNDPVSPTGVGPKRKPGKKTLPVKRNVTPGKVLVTPKKLSGKKSDPKVQQVKVTKKATVKKLSGKKVTTTTSVGEIANNASVGEAVSEGVEKKSTKKVKLVVNNAKGSRAKKVKATSLSITRNKAGKGAKKVLKSKPSPGMKRRGKKTRRKACSVSDVASGSESVPGVEPPTEQTMPASCVNHQLQVIDGVARNVIKGGCAVAKKAKDNESCVIKGKASVKNKKLAAKKTPKNVEEITKSAGVIESEICDGVNAAVKKVDKISDKELCPSASNTKTKVVVKKKLKEAEKEIHTKKIAPKKTSVKAVKLVSKVVRKPKVASGKVKKILATRKKVSKREKRSSSEHSKAEVDDNGEHSSTSDEFTLDLLLQRQKQIKPEEVVVKSESGDVKPRMENIKSEAPSSPTSPVTHVKGKPKVKVEAKMCGHSKAAQSALKKKLVKKALASKLKTKTAALKKQNTVLAKRLKLAACKTKVKRIRPTEVTKLAGGSGSDNEQRARRIKLFGFWSGPKRHRVASLNALAKVHCLYENESRSALLSVCTKPASSSGGSVAGDPVVEVDPVASTRTLRSGPGRQGVGKHWDQQTSSSTSSSEDNTHSDDCAATLLNVPPSYKQKQDSGLISKKPMPKPVKKVKKPRRREVIMDLKDMVVRKRMASLNASAILAASYSVEKPKKIIPSVKEDDSPRLSLTDEEKTNVRKKKVKKKFLSKQIVDDDETDDEGPSVIELATANNKKVATVIVNQDTDVTITGVYVNSTTHRSSTTHEGYCSIAGMQYRISSTSHTQTEATAVATETLLHAAPEHVAAPEPPTQPLKSYTPLGALSNMQPPGGPLSPLGRRHGCSSAFTAPPNVQPPPPPPPPPPHHHHLHPPQTQGPQEPPPPPPPYMHGYYQPAGPLISAHHHHGLPKPSVLPPLEASPTPTPPTLTAASSSGTRGGDESSDNDVVITATSCSNQAYANPPSQSQQPPSVAPTYRYPPNYPLPPTPQHVHHQYPYTQYPQQYYPAGVQGVQYSGAPPQQHYHHTQDMCYSAPSYPPAPPYYHHKTYSTPPPVSYPRRYGPPGPPHPSQYYSPELYSQGTEQQAPSRQMVATASTSGGGYQPPVESYPPPPTMVDPYPPPPPPPTGYYTGYPPAPSCYQHSPPTRSLAFIDTAYQGCPCPMQSCPKNVHTGPLTGDGKGPDSSAAAAATFHQLPLPPVALALPLEPPNAMGPPSPARGSAGMHPPPSPLATAQGNNAAHYSSKQEPFTAHHHQGSEMAQDLSSKNVGLLTIHKPPEPTLMVLQAMTPVKTGASVDNNVQAVLKCDIEPKHQHAKVNRLDVKEQQTVDFSKVDPKVERNVKVEVGNFESEAVPTGKTARKRKMKMENVSSPKPKKRNITAVKKVPVSSKQFSSEGDNVSIKIETPAQRKSKNQPLSSANSCSLHNSKQNAKKRKLSDAKDLSENQEPAPVVSKRKSVEEKAVKEPKSRPKLCPARTQTTKAKSIKPTKKAAAIAEQSVANVCESIPTNEFVNNVVNLQSIDKEAAATIPVTNVSAGPVGRKKPTKAQLNKTQSVPNGVPESPGDSGKANGAANRKKLQPKSLLSKIPPSSNGVVPISSGKVQRRRQTDSDAIKVSHMLRSHGMSHEPRPAETERMTNNSKSAAISPQALALLPTKTKLATVKKQTAKNGFAQSMEIVLSQQLLLKKGNYLKPKWSNGWSWEGEAFQAKVHLNSEETGVERRCYPAMRHNEGDIIRPRDCILLKSGPRKLDLPFVAKVAQLWENPDDGEMMVSLLWYYRPEHTENGRRPEDMPDEIFASKHKDTNSVACIEDKCYVLTFNEYCRYRAGARRSEEGMLERRVVVPQHEAYPRFNRQPAVRIAPDMVFFCRRVYDFRQKRILKNPG